MRKRNFPKFDYDRAYALVSVCSEIRESTVKDGRNPGSCFARFDELLAEANDGKCPVPSDVVSAFLNAWNILEASEDEVLLECLPCPFHYGCRNDLDCGRNCHESATAIWALIGTDDDILRAWLVHR